MKRILRFTAGIWLLSLLISPANAAFTSLYAFGDGACTTTTGPGGANYYGYRRTNGRIWIEVLAEQQGLTYESNKNVSFYGHYSPNLLTNIHNFTPPADANTALFIIWVNDADFVDCMGKIWPSLNLAAWTNAINQSLNNHFTAVTNLYAKGARTLILPSAVDITKIPQYNGYPPADRTFIRQRIIDFNAAFTTTWLDRVKINCPNLTVYMPDFFSLLDDVLSNYTNYGLIHVLNEDNNLTCVLESEVSKTLNGPGTNYIFWTTSDPTAKLHAHMADFVQQFIWPVQIGSIAHSGASNRLDLVHVPVGRNGYVEIRTNLMVGSWTSLTSFSSISTNQSVFVPNSGPHEYYRLRFPFYWAWP